MVKPLCLAPSPTLFALPRAGLIHPDSAPGGIPEDQIDVPGPETPDTECLTPRVTGGKIASPRLAAVAAILEAGAVNGMVRVNGETADGGPA